MSNIQVQQPSLNSLNGNYDSNNSYSDIGNNGVSSENAVPFDSNGSAVTKSTTKKSTTSKKTTSTTIPVTKGSGYSSTHTPTVTHVVPLPGYHATAPATGADLLMPLLILFVVVVVVNILKSLVRVIPTGRNHIHKHYKKH